MSKNVPDESVQKLLKQIVDFAQDEDRAVRERQIRVAKQLKYFWDGLTNVWWSDTAHDWRVWDQQVYESSFGDAAFYDKRVNVFRAYLESIIAALSTTVPPIKCAPDDAENPLDISTAKGAEKIAKLLYKHNDVNYLWAHALFVYCTEGLIFGYNYVREDKKYGTYEEDEYKSVEEDHHICPFCGGQIDELFSDTVSDQNNPGPDQVPNQLLAQEDLACPRCSELVDPRLQKAKIVVQKLVGTKTSPKSRVCLEAYGKLYVKVPSYAKTPEECPYLIYSHEVNYVDVRARFENLRSKTFNAKDFGPGSGGVYDPYERWGRLSPQYLGEYPVNTVTLRYCWLRPTSYHYLTEQSEVDKLKKLYPNGCKVIFANDEFAEAYNEDMDDHWTIARNPLSDHLHFQPLGLLLTSIQDITNELVSLVLQTIEHGIPQTFADPGVLNFDAYRQVEVAPGMIFPAAPKGGKSLSDAFYEVKTATLSAETLPFGQEVQQLGQFVSGALPSLYGGSQPNSSKTAAQYSMSKNQAMQRLQTPWKMITSWWKDMYAKAIPMYIDEMVEDERFVDKNSTGDYINVFIRKAELDGQIGDIELEAAENLPMSWMQKKDTIMQFLQAANPVVMEALVSPENLGLLAEIVGLDDIKLPGADDRLVQMEEIVQLINTQPMLDPMLAMQVASMGGDPEEAGMPSVPIEPDVDNHEIHARICRSWLVSEAGRLAKTENAPGYLNVLLHMKQHQQIIAMQQAMQMEQEAAMNGEDSDSQGGPDKKGAKSGKPANDKVMAPKDSQHVGTTH